MELQLLWAGVRFSARNGNGEGLLSEAARTGLHLSEVTPQPGGFAARCAAWRYRKLAALARKRRVRLHIAQRTGLYFFLRPFLRRRGLWAGLLLFVPLLLWSQNFVWAVDPSSLSAGQQARAKQILRETCSIAPGSFITQEKLTAGEYALLQSGERRRKAGRRIGQNRRNRGPHQSHRRHDAGHPRTGRGGRAAPHRHGPHRAGRHPHLRTRRWDRLRPIRLGARADRAADRFHKTPDRAAVQPPCRFV